MDDVDWASGGGYTVGWWLYIFLLFPTFVFNVGTFLLITYSPRLHASSNALLVRYLSVEDAAFALFCLVQCLSNLGHQSMYGGQAACELQASYLLFFALSTGYTLCCIAYNSEQKIGFKPGLSPRQVLYLHLAAWTLAAVIAVVSTAALAPARLVPSGTYCMPALNDLGPLLLVLGVGTVVIGCFLNHRYYLMWRHIHRHNAASLSAWEEHRRAAQARQVTIAKRMMLIIAVYFLCYFPEIALNVWELAAGQQAPAAVHVVTGSLIHLNSFMNPVLYVYGNGAIRAALWETFKRSGRHRVAPTPASPQSPTSGEPQPPLLTVSAMKRSTVLEDTSTKGGALLPTRAVRSPSSAAKPNDRILPPVRAFKLHTPPGPLLEAPLEAVPQPGASDAAEATVDHPFQPAMSRESLIMTEVGASPAPDRAQSEVEALQRLSVALPP